MSSKRGGGGGDDLYQSSLFRYTKAKPRKSAPAVPSRATNSSFKDEIPSTSKVGASIRSGDTRVHSSPSKHSIAPTQTSAFESSSGTPREVKENRAPFAAVLVDVPSSSPIPGLSTPWDQTFIQREKLNRLERDRGDTAVPVSTPTFTKRKARGWTLEEHSERVDGEPSKRRRRTSSSLSPPPHEHASHATRKDVLSTSDSSHPQSATTTTPRTLRPAAAKEDFMRLFHDSDCDIDAGSGAIIESSQTQPLLTPERPTPSSLQAPSSPVCDTGIVRSSQSPSPLKSASLYSTITPVGFNFVSTALKANSSPPKAGLEVPEAPVARRRRVPDPGTVSLFGVRGAGVSNPPEPSLDIESPLARSPYSGVKLIRRQGRYSIPLSIDDNELTTSLAALESEKIQSSPHTSVQSPMILPVIPVDHTSARTPVLEPMDDSENEDRVGHQPSDPGPFWETQPLLDLDFDTPLSSSTSPRTSPSPSSRISLPPTSSPRMAAQAEPSNVRRAEVLAETSGSETEQDSPTPFLPPTRYNALSTDPDKTIVASTPTRQKRGAALGPETSSTPHIRHSFAGETVFVISSDSTGDSLDGGGSDDMDGDQTMVNHRRNGEEYPALSNGKVKEGDIRDVTRGLGDLSPFKQEKKHPAAHKPILRLHNSEVIVLEEGDSDDPVSPLVVTAGHAMPLEEETQDGQTYTQLWPGTSLPAGWNAFETPKKPKRQPRLRIPNGCQSESFGGGITFTEADDEDLDLERRGSDDVFGPEATPGTLEREKPDAVKAFEALPSPYAGMFSGRVEGESESESEAGITGE